MLGVRTAGPRQVLSDSRRVLGGFLAVLGRFSAYLQGILGRFSFRLALDSIFEGSGAPEVARMVPGWPKRWPQGAQEAIKTMKKSGLFYKPFLNALEGATATLFLPNLGTFWEPF